MGGEWARPMCLLLTMVLVMANTRIEALCPRECRCNDDILHAFCESANLQFVPIQLNPEVVHINLSDNKIPSVNYMLSIYTNLVTLDLSRNKLQKLGSENFVSHKNLKYLNLSNNEVESLSKDCLKGLGALSELDLSFNKLKNLEGRTFQELQALEVLKLTANRLEYLDSNLFDSTKLLRELLLDNNQLTDVPALALANLQHLSLSKNLIASIEDGGVPNLPELRVLRLSENVISVMHSDALSGLVALEYLDLSDNNITSVPTNALAKLSKLTKLKLSSNFIVTIPPVAFRGLFQLKFLHLDKLELLSTIDSRAFVDNINLECVYLDNNAEVVSLPTRLFRGNPHIMYISVQNNQLSTLEATHFPLDQLKRLRLGGNPFTCNCSLLWLWRIAQEQRKRTNNASVDENELTIDQGSIRCAGPETLRDVLLEDTTESQMGCSVGLVTTISAVVSGCLVLGLGLVLLYIGPLKRRSCSKKENTEKRRNVPNVNVIEAPVPIVRDYTVLSSNPWEKYCESGVLPVSVDMYKQFNNGNPTSRPHIVYV